MERKRSRLLVAVAFFLLAGCAGASFKSVWKAPMAGPWPISGKRIAALVIADTEAVRRNAEELVVEELNGEGALGQAGYTIVREEPAGDIQGLLSASKAKGMDGALLIRAAYQDQEPRPRSGIRWGIGYGGFRGRYGGLYDTWYDLPEAYLTVETRFYDLKEGRILWTGATEWTSSSLDEKALGSIARASLMRMLKEGVITR